MQRARGSHRTPSTLRAVTHVSDVSDDSAAGMVPVRALLDRDRALARQAHAHKTKNTRAAGATTDAEGC
jgi:hypothetical protein